MKCSGARVTDYSPRMLDQLFLAGRFAWARGVSASNPARRTISRNVPLMILTRSNLSLLSLPDAGELSHYGSAVREFLLAQGASFFADLKAAAGLFEDHLISGMKELVARGLLTADSFKSLDSLFPDRKRIGRYRRADGIAGSGRWSLLREMPSPPDIETAVARILLARYGVVFRYLAEREFLQIPWSSFVRVLRRLEMQGELRGGRFIREAWGEQFALPSAVAMLKETKATAVPLDLLVRTDPLRAAFLLQPLKS
jgi:ATP-dependent Lhr-like helicase